MQVSLTGHRKLVNVNVNGCLSLCISLAMDWQWIDGWKSDHHRDAGTT